MPSRDRVADALAAALDAIGRSLTSSLDLDEVLDTVAERALAVMTADAALVVGWDGQAADFTILRAAGRLSREYLAAGSIPAGGGPIFRAVRDARPAVTRNLLADPLTWLTPARRATVEAEGYRAVAAAPLTATGRVHGALVVHYWSERDFDDVEVDALARLAEQAALAIDTARLYADAARGAQRATRLGDLIAVTNSISASLETSEVMQRVVAAAAALAPEAMAFLHAYDPARHLLRALARTGREIDAFPPEFPANVGLPGVVFEQRAALLEASVAAHPRTFARDWWAARPAATYYGLPIVAGDTVLGVLSVILETRAPSLEEQEFLQLLAAHAGVAIRNAERYEAERAQADRIRALADENARVLAESERERREAQALARAASRLATTLDIDEVGRELVDALRELFGAHASALYRVREDGVIVSVAFGGPARQHMPSGQVMPRAEGIIGRAVEERRPVWSRDVLHDPGVRFSDGMRAAVAASGNRAVLAVPLLAKDEVMGALAVSDRTPRDFDPRETALLQAFADQAAVALQNARLYASARDSLARLRETQEQLVQAAKMSALGQLVSGVAHELNNPLSVVIGYGQLLLNRDVPPSLRRPLELMVSQGDRMAKIVRNLLLFARQRPPERGPVHLDVVLEETLALRQSQLSLSDIVVVKDFVADLPSIAGDAPQLQQVFLNLILNAEQSIAERGTGGEIILRTRVAPDHGSVRAEVVDDGPGIPPDALPRVFEPFFTTKQVGSGTGLGLSVSYGIVQEHGGRLTADSRPGATTFAVELPVATPVVRTAAAPVSPALVVEARHALVVEDEPSVSDLVVDLLRDTGWRVDVAPGGRVALERVGTRQYDLIVCDLRMPDIGGEELYRRVTAADPSLARRFVFVTGDTANPDVWRFLRNAGAPVVEKPFEAAVFLDAVRRVTASLTPSVSSA